MLVVAHFNDGKDKWQSHEMYIGVDTYSGVSVVDNHEMLPIIGYGSTKEEAFEEMKTVFEEYYKALGDIKKKLDDGEYTLTEVNCLGKKPISK